MSPLHASVRARRRLVPLLVSALVAALAVFGLSPVPAANAADPTLSFVASTSTAGSRTSHTVTVPAGVQSGDTMVVFLTVNSLTGTLGSPAGWTLLQSKDGTATRGRAWTKKATATDAGSAVIVPTSASLKSTMSIAVYRSSAGTSSVTASASTAGTTSTTSFTTPSVAVAQTGSWLVSSWSEKTSTATTWTTPASSTMRTTPSATGGGLITSLVADSNAAVPTGTAAGRTATTNVAGGNAQLFSVVVSPGTGTTPANQAPVPSFTSACAGLNCTFDASASTDADNDPMTYAWNFGDAATGTGVSTNHTYASASTRTVTLTVSDGKTTAQTTRSVSPTSALPGPGHTALVPETPHNDMPKITDGEIFDMEIVGARVFIAGTFTKIQNKRSNNTTTYNQAGIASYNMNTGLVDATFRPNVAGAEVDSVEATPDGTKLYIAGTFNTVNGTTRKALAQINMTTGAPVTAFNANLDARASEIATTNSTVYVGGRFTKVGGLTRTSLAAVNATTGAVDTGFVNNLSGGVGVSGALTVQRLMITHDQSKLIVVHTGRQINGQDRYGVGMIDIATKQLLPWRTRLWEDNLQFVGGIQRAYGGDIAPDDSYFVVTSGSGGDRPPINDTVMAFPVNAGANPSDVQTKWIARCFDSVYSVAISEKAVYVGGHFSWNESPTSPDPWPGLDDVGYGTGQGLSGYGLGDAVVRREHLGALNPVDGKALEWSPESNSYEGNKAMAVTPRGLFTGGDATTQGGLATGRIAFFDFNSVTAGNGVDSTITDPIQGRVEPVGTQWVARGTAVVTSGSINRVEVRVLDRDTNQYLQDNKTTWGASNTINATLQSTGARTATWSLPLTITGNRRIQLRAQTFSSAGTSDSTPAIKKIETFGLADQPPTTNVTGPTVSPVRTKTFTITGTANDDMGVNSVGMTIRDINNHYLQADGTMSSTGYTFRITPDVVGAPKATWSKEITVPSEGTWRSQARAVDTGGQTALDTADRSWIVTEDGQPPTVAINKPVVMLPPTAVQPVVVTPGTALTFSGSANDDQSLNNVQISLRNNTTREGLAADGSWGTDVVQDWHVVSPTNLSAASYNWTFTLPAASVKPGSYTFQVRATDNLDLTTSSANRGVLTVNAQVPGDAPPDTTISPTGTITGTQTLHLDLAGTASDDKGVSGVKVTLKDNDTGKYVQTNGTLATAFAMLPATVTANGASWNWTLPVNLPQAGDYSVTAYAFDTANQQDISTSGATARYPVYPGDVPPTLTDNLLAPTENTVFSDGRIFVSGRAEDDQAMQRVEIAITDSQGRYLASNGTFPSPPVASWRTAFLTSPGTPGSNFSYTSPVVPEGAYTIQVRGVDQHDQVTAVPSVRHVTVTHPAGNNAPVAHLTTSCSQNVCTLDGRTSTDENAATMTYAWDFGNGTTGTGPVPVKTYDKPGTYTVSLTVTDEWGIPSATPATTSLTITEPTNNAPPVPKLNPPACSGLVCNFSAVGTTDPNTGDSITYSWNFGDGTALSTTAAASHTYAGPGTYTVTLTATDGWGKSASATTSLTLP